MLRFKNDDGSEFPEWEEHEIAELIQLYNEKVSSDCQLPILTSSKKNGIEYQEEHFTGKQRHDIEGYNVLPRNYCTYRNRSDGTDFTFNINKLCDKGIVSKFYPVFKEKDCDLFFLVSLLNNERKTVRKIAYTAKGTGQKVLSITDLRNITVNMPSLPEQQKIAEFLSTIDTVIEKQKETVSAWEERKKGVMQKLFSQEVRFKADDGSNFPEWEEKKLNEIAVRVTRKNKDNVTDIPLTISSADGLIDQRNFFNKVVASKDMSGYFLLKNGEFAYNKSYSKGYNFGSIKRLDLYDEGALSTLYICFALNKNENSDFYQKYFDSLSWYPELQKICAEGARNHGLLNVPTNDFFQLKLCVPSSDKEQHKIADCLSSLDEVIEKQKETLVAWEELKKGLLQQMFV